MTAQEMLRAAGFSFNQTGGNVYVWERDGLEGWVHSITDPDGQPPESELGVVMLGYYGPDGEGSDRDCRLFHRLADAIAAADEDLKRRHRCARCDELIDPLGGSVTCTGGYCRDTQDERMVDHATAAAVGKALIESQRKTIKELADVVRTLLDLVEDCRSCDGSGAEPGYERGTEACHHCGGVGEIIRPGACGEIGAMRAAVAKVDRR